MQAEWGALDSCGHTQHLSGPSAGEGAEVAPSSLWDHGNQVLKSQGPGG